MKKTNVKKGILLIIMIVMILCTITTKVNAAIDPLNLDPTNGKPNGNEDPTNTPTIPPTNTPTTPPTNTPTTPPTNTPSNEPNTTLPQTGDASDYILFTTIAVVVIIAIYAYKKVKDYNI